MHLYIYIYTNLYIIYLYVYTNIHTHLRCHTYENALVNSFDFGYSKEMDSQNDYSFWKIPNSDSKKVG